MRQGFAEVPVFPDLREKSSRGSLRYRKALLMMRATLNLYYQWLLFRFKKSILNAGEITKTILSGDI